MPFNDPFYSSNNFGFDNPEVSFDDLGLTAGMVGIAGRPPVIPSWLPGYGGPRKVAQ